MSRLWDRRPSGRGWVRRGGCPRLQFWYDRFDFPVDLLYFRSHVKESNQFFIDVRSPEARGETGHSVIEVCPEGDNLRHLDRHTSIFSPGLNSQVTVLRDPAPRLTGSRAQGEAVQYMRLATPDLGTWEGH